MQVAQTILSQLGGNKFIAMTGARNLVGDQAALQFSIPQRLATNKANKVRVTLGSDDLYSVEFFSIRGINVRSVSSHERVYADQLRDLFTAQTGMATSL